MDLVDEICIEKEKIKLSQRRIERLTEALTESKKTPLEKLCDAINSHSIRVVNATVYTGSERGCIQLVRYNWETDVMKPGGTTFNEIWTHGYRVQWIDSNSNKDRMILKLVSI